MAKAKNWEDRARLYLKAEIKRADITYEELAKRLKACTDFTKTPPPSRTNWPRDLRRHILSGDAGRFGTRWHEARRLIFSPPMPETGGAC